MGGTETEWVRQGSSDPNCHLSYRSLLASNAGAVLAFKIIQKGALISKIYFGYL